MKKELERKWQEVILAQFALLSGICSGRPEANYEVHHSGNLA
jgi:hypothetical protein